MHVTKVYFIQLVLKIKYAKFEDTKFFFIKNLWECESFCAWWLIKEFPTKNWKIRTLDYLLWKLWTTSSIEHTVMINFKIMLFSLYVVLFYQETQLGWSGKFC